jgi:hypothetical protein
MIRTLLGLRGPSERTCQECRTGLDHRDVAVRIRLPDILREPPPGYEAVTATSDEICMVIGHRAWVRVTIQVRLAGGGRFGIGTWLEIEWEALPGVLAAWADPDAYRTLELDGWLANGLPYWGEDATIGVPARATVHGADELPLVTASSDPLLTRIIEEEWPIEEVHRGFRVK